MTKAYKEAEIKEFGKIYKTDAPFDQALKALKEMGIPRLITTRDLAYTRIKRGKNSSLCKEGSYTRHGLEYAAQKPVLLNRTSSLLNLKLARKAVESNKDHQYFSTYLKLYEKHYKQAKQEEKEKEPEKRKILILPSRDTFTFSKNEDVAKALFRDVDYFSFINKNSIKFDLINKDLIDNQKKTILTQIWLCSLDDDSGVGGGSRSLYCAYRVRGVLESCEAGAKFLPKPNSNYNRQLNAQLRRLNKIAQGTIKISDLEAEVAKVSGFLQKLKQQQQK